MRKIFSTLSVLALILAVAVTANAQTTIYLKGTGAAFDKSGWTNVFDATTGGTYTEGACGQYPNVWHLVYSGKEFFAVDKKTGVTGPSAVTEMQLTFTNGEAFNWMRSMGPSLNGGGNNPGWVLVAPYDWKIAYVNSGNNNVSQSFVVTNEKGNNQFNISGFTPGKPNDPPVLQDPPNGPPTGDFTLIKKVGGLELSTWDPSFVDIFMGVKFELRAGDENGELIDTFTCEADFDGTITFKNVVAGKYAVVENFEDAPDAAALFGGPDPVFVQVIVTFDGEVIAFDRNAHYTIVNGYGWADSYVLGYSGLNNTGDIFYIGVTNTETGETYDSFCANAGSRAFAGQSGMGCTGYMVALNQAPHSKIDDSDATISDFIAAFNYIEDNVGSLNTNRGTTQAVVWALLDAIDVNSSDFEMMRDSGTDTFALDKEAVKDVLANYKGYVSTDNKVIDVVFFVCEHEHGYADCQPQLVPIYANTPGSQIVFNNVENAQFGTLSAFAHVFDHYVDHYYYPVFGQDGNGEKTLTLNGKFGDNNINYVIIDAADLYTTVFDVAVSFNNSGKDPKIGVQFMVTEDGVVFDKDVFKSDYSVLLFSSKPNIQFVNQENKHGNTIYDFTTPGSDKIYLFFHNQGGLTWYTDEIVDWVFDHDEEYDVVFDAFYFTVDGERFTVLDHEKFSVGSHHVCLFDADGNVLAEKDVEVVANEDAECDFGDVCHYTIENDIKD